ncbi:hypothetical protein EKO27_g4253 [Xylaria grammica]|uniref:Uncharacterized protein n=1 Tax=Xylaria grammica TaxID=363999 RepID=A0A439D8U4_9PEZI|nr:hypothetical protein EKO27_g4253 [Xylaria grammica]
MHPETDSRATRSAGDAASGRFGVVAIQETEGRVRTAKTRVTSRVCSYGYETPTHPITSASLPFHVSSTERHLKDSDYTYNLEAARTYANQSQGAVSPLSSLPQYAHEIATGDGLTSYRQSPYPYSSSSSKGYYPTMSGWANTYTDDGSNVDYSLGYSSYQIINQETPALVPGYSQYNTRKSVYVDPETPPYSYGNLVHRPAVSSDNQGFSLSSMAASLPSASDRLHSSVNRTLTSSSSYRGDGIAAQYTNTKASPANGIADVAYSNLQPSFDPPYSTTGTLASTIAHRPSSHADTAAYPPGATTAQDQLYTPGEQTLRPTEDASGGLGYVYGETKLSSSQRDSHPSGGVSASSLLSNGHVYVPDSHSAHPTPHPTVRGAAQTPGPRQKVFWMGTSRVGRNVVPRSHPAKRGCLSIFEYIPYAGRCWTNTFGSESRRVFIEAGKEKETFQHTNLAEHGTPRPARLSCSPIARAICEKPVGGRTLRLAVLPTELVLGAAARIVGIPPSRRAFPPADLGVPFAF